MSLRSAPMATRPQRPGFWSRLAADALIRLLSGAPPVRVEATPPRRASVVGVRKTALCRDACGGLRRIDFLLPGDLVAQLSRPLDIEFVDGDQPLTADEISKAVQANFLKAFAGSA